MEALMVSTAHDRQITHLMSVAIAPELDVMKIKIPRRSAAGDGAAMMIVRKYLAVNARCHGRLEAFRLSGVCGAEEVGVVPCTFDDLGADIEIAAGAVLPAASAPLA